MNTSQPSQVWDLTVARGWPGTTTPGDRWRIQLWPARGDQAPAPRRLRAWTPPG